MDKAEISRVTMHRIIALSYKKENKEIIERFIEESQSEQELIKKLKKAFKKYETIQFVHAELILPTGNLMGICCYMGEGVPKECSFTSLSILKDWQKRVNRSPKLRKQWGIELLNEKCPYCRGRIFLCKGHKWCNGFPTCKYEEETEEERRRKYLFKK